MKIPEKCGNGHVLTKGNVRLGRVKNGDGYRERWYCKTCNRERCRKAATKRENYSPHLRRGMHENVEAGPFLRWFESYCRRYDLSRKEAAQGLGIDEKQVRRCYKPNRKRGETGKISVAAVDKALLYMDTNIRDLYPSLYENE
jgi:hypothetical protein